MNFRLRRGEPGLHLFDRVSGLNILIDEVSVPLGEWSQGPAYLSIAVTNACDLDCAYCYAPKQPALLSPSQIFAWAQELDSLDGFGVGFGGGEPLLFPQFPELCQRVHDQTGLAVTFTTHGHRFTDSIVERLRGGVDFIRVSMDGLGATYERLRKRPFDRLPLIFDQARSISAFGVNYVVNRMTLEELPAATEFVFASGATELLLLPEIDASGCPSLTEAELDRLGRWIRSVQGDCRLAISVQGDVHEAIGLDILRTHSSDPTYDFMHVTAGGVLKASAFEAQGINLGESMSLRDGIMRLRSQRGNNNENLALVR